jgi:hypothetical protein
MNFNLVALGAASLLLAACTSTPVSEVDHSGGSILLNSNNQSEIVSLRPDSIQAQPNDIYIRKVNSRKKETHLVSIKRKSMPIAEAVMQSRPGINFIALDAYVDIRKKVDVYVNGMAFESYLQYLSAISGYEIVVSDNVVSARSYIDMDFNMAALADNQKSSVVTSMSGNQSSELTSSSTTDKWGELMEVCDSVLGVSSWMGLGSQPYCNGVRSVGVITASGPPSKMKVLDSIFTSTEKIATQMILVEIKWLDISLGKRETLKQTTLMIKNNTSAVANIGSTYKIASNEKSNGGVELSNVDVGLGFIITPRILGNKEVQVDIIPSISRINEWRDAELSTAVADTPVIEFNNFSTQIITRSDKAVQVGEFSDTEITTLMTQAINGNQVEPNNNMHNLLTSDGNGMRKIIMMVTPKIVSGV